MTAFPEARTAVLTGVGSPRGIGRRTAHLLAERGWNLGLMARTDEQAQDLAQEISASYGVQALGAGADVTVSSEVAEVARLFEAELPQIVGLANFAGVSSAVPYLEITDEEWTRVLTNNLTATHIVTQTFGRIMADAGVGRIVGLSSVTAQRGGGTFSKTAYAASKAGIIGLIRGVARELGPFGVCANSISPGPVDTDIMGGTLDDGRRNAMAADTVLGRISTTDDVAAATAFLLSEEAGHITGQTLSINGGLHFH
ncbi:SDR family oxidoreductase [Brevibacterium sp.]|uniref:SDR family NAD(P)-dependent oxidoreductase n=1 Tax=Brevibacterium sp. TaxID=1701 RepID=UPI002810C989|nr:SDR family oxidoreductase [Brevibacterium sp.]